jgi:hypothetical protein
MNTAQRETEFLKLITTTARPLYTEITALRVVVNAIKLKLALKSDEVDQMLEFARHSEDTAKSVDLELTQLSKMLRLAQQDFETKHRLLN